MTPDSSLAFRTGEDHPLLAAFGLSAGRYARLNRNIHMEDEMLIQYLNLRGQDRDAALVAYFDSGRRLWEAMAALLRWRFPEDPGPGFQILDFASGYGRVTRFAVLDLPPERIWVADIYAGGVRFQEEHLGVHGLISYADPARFECNETFDAVLVSSLFTHLPEETFRSWLARLWSLVRPGGMLAFSVHDRDLVPPGEELPAGGLLFHPHSESGSLPNEQYGTSWVDEPFVRRIVADVAPGASLHRIPRGLVNFQDLYVLVPEPDADFSGLRWRSAPEVFVEHVSTIAGRLWMVGWLADRTLRRPPRELRLRIGGQVRQTVRDFTAREDVSALFPYEKVQGHGWSFEASITPEELDGNATLEIEVIDAEGHAVTPESGPVAFYLLRTALLGLHAARVEIHHKEEALTREKAHAEDLRRQAGALEERLAWMRASRFWKLREAWFRLKRKAGLTKA